ncbi:hypothetical protein B0H17DRAFT_1218545 [Mycena rosella]|uniref:Antifreeze protein n=1 Tax=Mycena rosella TaxID=1033263 RepID=A0AAD7BP55_MYCRO|nr:hypothetical protein B0H17DRAFT_1218545 [Mycena rosella]
MPCNILQLSVLAAVGSALAAGPPPVLLGTAANFAILAKSGVSTVPNSVTNGSIGISPATITSVTGFDLVQDVSGQFWTSPFVNGRVMGATDALPTPALLTAAVLEMQAAYTDAMITQPVGKSNLGQSRIPPGVYLWVHPITLPTITLFGGPMDTWIFQISGTTLSQLDDADMILGGGALAQNVVWAVSGTVSTGNNGVFQGKILSQTNIVIATNATVNGCVYAQTAVTLQQASVLCNGAAVIPPITSSSPTSTSTPTPSPSSTVATATCALTSTAAPTASATAPGPCFSTAFQNLNASIVAEDYLGFNLVDTVEAAVATAHS